MRPEFDFIIVGAGLTGAAAAIALGNAGRRVLVIERRAGPHDAAGDARALVLSLSSATVLRRIGLWQQLEGGFHPVQRVHVSEAGGFAGMTLSAAELGCDALGWACPADVLLAGFHRAMVDNDNVSIVWAAEYTGFSCDDATVSVLARVAAASRQFSASALVAADGSGSSIVAAAGMAVSLKYYGQQAVVSEVTLAGAEPHTAIEHFTAEGALAMIPVADARAVAVQCVDDDTAAHLMSLDDPSFLACLARRGGARAGRLLGCGPRRAHPLVLRRVVPAVAAPVIAIGNAATTVHPNAAQGLNLGLRDVAALLATLDAGHAPADCFDAYANLRTDDQAAIAHATDWLAVSGRSRLRPLRWLRRGGLAALATQPLLRRQLLREATGLAPLARMAQAAGA